MSELAAFTVLWIEDQLDKVRTGVVELRRLLSENLTLPVEIHEACSQESAQIVLSELQSLDLILLDVILPRTEAARKAEPPRVDMNAGYLLWHKLRKQSVFADTLKTTPICVVTARARPVFRAEMTNDPHLLWLDKPIPPSEIVDKIMTSLLQSRNCPDSVLGQCGLDAESDGGSDGKA